jgi:predicted RNA-binding protein YlxR (DUF448 family)
MGLKQKRIPQRMCVGCREMKNKRDMIRVVKNAEGVVSLDRTGKMAGRGAYVCNQVSCLEKAIRAKLLDKALDHKIEDMVYNQLREEFAKRE